MAGEDSAAIPKDDWRVLFGQAPSPIVASSISSVDTPGVTISDEDADISPPRNLKGRAKPAASPSLDIDNDAGAADAKFESILKEMGE